MKLLSYSLLIFGASCLLWRLRLRWNGVWASLESKGASRWFGWCRILQNNASPAVSKISVISVKPGEQNPWRKKKPWYKKEKGTSLDYTLLHSAENNSRHRRVLLTQWFPTRWNSPARRSLRRIRLRLTIFLLRFTNYVEFSP